MLLFLKSYTAAKLEKNSVGQASEEVRGENIGS